MNTEIFGGYRIRTPYSGCLGLFVTVFGKNKDEKTLCLNAQHKSNHNWPYISLTTRVVTGYLVSTQSDRDSRLTSLEIVSTALQTVVVVLHTQSVRTLLQSGEVGREPVGPQTTVVSPPPTRVRLLYVDLGHQS